MKLKELLLNFIPSKEIKARVNNKSIRINNDVIDEKYLTFPIDELIDCNAYIPLDEWIYMNIKHIPLFVSDIESIRDLFGTGTTNVKQLEFFTGWTLISLSKKEEHVFFNN